MDLNITGQYKYIEKKQEKLRKIVEEIDYRFAVLKKYIKHTEDIKIARRQKKLIAMEKLFHEIGI